MLSRNGHSTLCPYGIDACKVTTCLFPSVCFKTFRCFCKAKSSAISGGRNRKLSRWHLPLAKRDYKRTFRRFHAVKSTTIRVVEVENCPVEENFVSTAIDVFLRSKIACHKGKRNEIARWHLPKANSTPTSKPHDFSQGFDAGLVGNYMKRDRYHC